MIINKQYLCISELYQKILSLVIFDVINNKKYIYYKGYDKISDQKEECSIENIKNFMIGIKNNYDLVIQIKDKKLLNILLNLNFDEDVLNKNVSEFLTQYNLIEYAI